MAAILLSNIILADLSIKNNEATAHKLATKITAVFQVVVPKPNLEIINAKNLVYMI